jgi:hypothetical protein
MLAKSCPLTKVTLRCWSSSPALTQWQHCSASRVEVLPAYDHVHCKVYCKATMVATPEVGRDMACHDNPGAWQAAQLLTGVPCQYSGPAKTINAIVSHVPLTSCAGCQFKLK